MPKMKGTGKDPLGRYSDGLIFDLEDNDPAMVADFVKKGWATVLPEDEHPGRTVTQIAAAVVRGDEMSDPVEQAIAEQIGGNAHAIVHLDDPNATQADYDAEVEGARKLQKTHRSQISADSLGGVPAKGSSKAAKEEAPAKESASKAAPKASE